MGGNAVIRALDKFTAHFAESDHPVRAIPITQSGVFVTPLVGAVGTTATRVNVDPCSSPPRL